MKKQKQYQKNYRRNGSNTTRWTVDEILKELQIGKKSKEVLGTDNVEIYPKFNDCGNLHWQFEVYRYDEIVKQ